MWPERGGKRPGWAAQEAAKQQNGCAANREFPCERRRQLAATADRADLRRISASPCCESLSRAREFRSVPPRNIAPQNATTATRQKKAHRRQLRQLRARTRGNSRQTRHLRPCPPARPENTQDKEERAQAMARRYSRSDSTLAPATVAIPSAR